MMQPVNRTVLTGLLKQHPQSTIVFESNGHVFAEKAHLLVWLGCTVWRKNSSFFISCCSYSEAKRNISFVIDPGPNFG